MGQIHAWFWPRALTDKSALRDAATTIVQRQTLKGPTVLMGQRGADAAFMPGKFVFPGGAIDAVDDTVSVADIALDVQGALHAESARTPSAIVAAAIRELWEESGLILGKPGTWDAPPQGWRAFAATGHVPSAQGCRFFFRAVTPMGRPRRFDARFILVDADAIASDLDDFSRAEDELSHLQWVPLKDACSFDLPFITQVVLAELIGGAPSKDGVPFFRNDDEDRLVSRLGGASPI